MKIPNWIKYCIPRVVWTVYGEKDEESGYWIRTICIWRQWFDRTWDVVRFPVAKPIAAELESTEK